MTDYNKLTVVKLKEILKDRELPTSGLKAALVARLVEDDAKPAEEAKEPEPSPAPEVDTSAKSAIEPDAKPSESVVEQPPTKIQDDALPSASAAEEQPTVHPPAEVQDNTLSPSSAAEQLPTAQPPMEVQDDTLPPTSTVEEIPTAQSTRATSLEKEELPQTGVDDVPQIASQPSEDAQVAPTQEQPPQEDDPKPPVAPETEDIRIPSSAHTIIEVAMPIESNMSQPGPPSATEILVSRSQPLPSKEQPGSTPEALLRERSTQASVDRDELMEDSRKRKRRSQSPPPSTLDTAIKKAKALDGSPRVVMQEDLQTQQHPTQETELNYIGDSMELDTQERPKNEDPIDSKTQYSQETAGPSHYIKSLKPAPEIDRIEKPAEGATQQSHPPSRPPPTSTKFKGLFEANQGASVPKTDQEPDTTIEDRDVAPAMHPATSALYIRNFMRPLHPGNLKDYLQNIARLQSDTEGEEFIVEFHLDPIKTHCLVQFSSVSAASRVRMAMHDRVWPDERTRKALWVDFVPEGKIKKWIEVEQEAGSGRGAPQMRWEVVYEMEDDGVMAYLQEADPSGRGPAPRRLGNDSNHNGHGEQAPARPEPVAPKGDPGKGFKALNDLFKFTTAKPKLYYQPVAEDIARQRLDRLAEGKGGGRSDEMRRFTFEEDTIVDKGPEFGANYRGGGRGRGGHARGGYSSRGGYRGDNWRDGH